MTDYDQMIQSLDAIHASASDLAAFAAALRTNLCKLPRPKVDPTDPSYVSEILLGQRKDDPLEAQLSFMWDEYYSPRTVIIAVH